MRSILLIFRNVVVDGFRTYVEIGKKCIFKSNTDKTKNWIFTLGILFIAGLNLCAQNFEIVLEIDQNGETTQGSKLNLIDKVCQGQFVRVAWELDRDDDGISEIEHGVYAAFITIIGENVFAQLEWIYQQFPSKDRTSVKLSDSGNKWVATIGTDGNLQSRMIIPNLHMIQDELEYSCLVARTKLKKSQ